MLNPLGSGRTRHGSEDEEIAYRLQVIGAREGFIKGAIIGTSLIALANWKFKWVQRQSIVGKTWVGLWGPIFGMVIGADKYLIEWEREHRKQEERWRDMARSEIAARGAVPSETAMRVWKAEYDAKRAAKAASPLASSPSPLADIASSSPAPTNSAPRTVFDGLQALKEDKAQAPVA
ncbi:hypothetical protein JCM8097_000694 [Rhodosporidiobolus ruineniae]